MTAGRWGMLDWPVKYTPSGAKDESIMTCFFVVLDLTWMHSPFSLVLGVAAGFEELKDLWTKQKAFDHPYKGGVRNRKAVHYAWLGDFNAATGEEPKKIHERRHSVY